MTSPTPAPSPLYTKKGTPVFGSEGLKIGTISKRPRPGFLVISIGNLLTRKDRAIPLTAVAGTDARAIYLKYTKDEIESDYPERFMRHATPGTPLGDVERIPLGEMQHQIDEANIPSSN